MYERTSNSGNDSLGREHASSSSKKWAYERRRGLILIDSHMTLNHAHWAGFNGRDHVTHAHWAGL